MGHIAHLRKQFKPVNTYNYHNTNLKKHYLLNGNRMGLHLQTLNSFTQGYFVPNLVEIGQVVLKKKILKLKILKFRRCIFAIS